MVASNRGEPEEGERLAELEQALALYEGKDNLVTAERTRSRLAAHLQAGARRAVSPPRVPSAYAVEVSAVLR